MVSPPQFARSRLVDIADFRDAQGMSEPPRSWNIEDVLQLMTEQSLLADMLPSFNEAEHTWDICLSDDRGNGIEYISFTSEQAAEAFCVALAEAIDRNATT